MEKPLISVIIPTRNRQEYAEKTINQIIGLKQNIEVIVHDNSDDDSLYHMIKDDIDEGKVKYSYEKGILPFSENYNCAAEMATGEYFCAIGDDDGILPNITECANWMKVKNIDIVKPAKDQVYFYPGNVNKKKNACIGFGKYSGSYYYTNPEAAIISLLDDGGCNYLDKNMAGSYHGLVRKDCMDRVKTLTGKYYSGLTPDMYSVVCLSLLPNIRFAIVDYPITLPGVCPSSGSAASDSGKHVGKLEDAPHLKALPDYQWSSIVPRYYSVETIWAETMIYAITKMQRYELVEKFYNDKRLASHLYINNKTQRQDILNVLEEEMVDYIISSHHEIEEKSNLISKYLENAAIKITGRRKVVRNISDIDKAVAVLNAEIESFSTQSPWEEI